MLKLLIFLFLFVFANASIKGLFDSWDINKTINNRQISTKIDNKEFNLTLASLNEDNDSLQIDGIGDINVSIYDLQSNKKISNTVYFNTNMFPEINATFKVSSVTKNAKVSFLICSNYNSDDNSQTLYNYSKCKGAVVDCNVTGLHFRRCFSSDSFAIRPYKFKITPIKSPIKAGKSFNLKIEALDYKGNPADNYNESIEINSSSSLTLDYNDSNNSNGCITGELKGVNLKFENGVANLDLNYSEVGDLNITIKEINGSEFAKVDNDDTSLKEREILPDSVLLKFIPDHFEINASYRNFDNALFTYLSNDLNMASILDINLSAENANNKITKNYNKKCYAKDFDLNISYGKVPKEINKILFKEKNNKEINISIPAIINEKLSKNYFDTENNGSAILHFYLNFAKNYREPINEFNFTIKEINISDEDDVSGTKVLDKNATFKYGRIDIGDISGYGNEINTTFKYEYWNNDTGWVINKDHNSSFGDVNISKSYLPNTVTMKLSSIKNGEENVTISTTHALPYSAKIHLSIPSWLWYHPLAKDYKDPSSKNLDCLTHPCFNIDFQKAHSGWGGIGTNQQKYQANKRTAEINSSSQKINVNKSVLKKINW